MAEIEVKPTASSKAANFLEKNKKGLVFPWISQARYSSAIWYH